MNTQSVDFNHGHEDQPEHSKSKAASLANCCGPEMLEKAEMMKGCPCAGLMTGSKKAFLAVLAGAGFLCLIALSGWVLGVVAFFRTL